MYSGKLEEIYTRLSESPYFVTATEFEKDKGFSFTFEGDTTPGNTKDTRETLNTIQIRAQTVSASNQDIIDHLREREAGFAHLDELLNDLRVTRTQTASSILGKGDRDRTFYTTSTLATYSFNA